MDTHTLERSYAAHAIELQYNLDYPNTVPLGTENFAGFG